MSNKNYPQKLNLAIIFGGQSEEHEVSLASAKGVINALDKQKYNIIPIAITKKGKWIIGDKGKTYLESQDYTKFDDFESDLVNSIAGKVNNKKIDLVAPIIHGHYGEDGKLQGILEILKLPYLFSDILASALAMNKLKTKIMAKEAGLNIAKHLLIKKSDDYNLDDLIDQLSLPMVVKPIESGSSIGVFIVENKDELKVSIPRALKHGNIMLEQYISGRELTVGVIGDERPEVLAVTEVIPKKSRFYDYKSKYDKGGSEHICPANIPDDILAKVKDFAIKAFKSIGARDLARVDFIWSQDDDKLYFLEINTIPGMTQTSLAPEQAKAAGMNFGEFLDKLINFGIKRNKNT